MTRSNLSCKLAVGIVLLANFSLWAQTANNCASVSASGMAWQNVSFPIQQMGNVFSAEVDAIPEAASVDTVIGFTQVEGSWFTDLVANVRFNTSGHIDAYSSTGYVSSSIPYSPNGIYHLRFVVDLRNHSYSAYVTPPGQAEQLIGSNLAFRSANAAVVRLSSWTMGSDSGALQACNFGSPSFHAAGGGTWTSGSFPVQSGTLTYEWDAIPSISPLDTVMALSNGAQSTFTGFACLVRFGSSGSIEVRNGASYAADNAVAYSAGTQYHFRLVANIPAHTYSVYVTPAGLAEVAVATNYAFRTEQSGVSALNNFGAITDSTSGNAEVANQRLTNPPVDRFGILKLRATLPGGREWFALWDNGDVRSFSSGDWDTDDPEFQIRGDVTQLSIDGAGALSMSGNGPRVYVYDRAEVKKWRNVEITFYAQRVSETQTVSFQGFVAGARSEHQDASDANPCQPQGGHAIYGRMLYDGRVNFQKEVVYHEYFSVNMPSEQNTTIWNTPNGTMPANQWIGYKYIVSNSPDNSQVTVTLYRDLTGGVGGGNWQQVAQSTDDGTWGGEPDNPWSASQVQSDCGFSAFSAFTNAATSIFIRNDYINPALYRNFSIREIAP